MTVRYSRLSPDFLQDIVDKLVPPGFETEDQKPTDTSEIDAMEPQGKSVH